MKLTDLFEERNQLTIKGKSHGNDYPTLIRSISKLKEILKEKYGSSKITLDGIIKLYAEFNMKLTDNISKIDFTVKELDKYREFDRNPKHKGGDSNLSPEEFKKLEDDIKKHGIKDYGIITLYQQMNGDVLASMGEGNHRLNIAKRLGINKMTMNIYFG